MAQNHDTDVTLVAVSCAPIFALVMVRYDWIRLHVTDKIFSATKEA